MNEDAKADAGRELEKIKDALIWAEQYFERTSEANAALHCSSKVMYSPLTAKLSAAIQSVQLVEARISE